MFIVLKMCCAKAMLVNSYEIKLFNNFRIIFAYVTLVTKLFATVNTLI